MTAQPVPTVLLDELGRAAQLEGATLHVLTGDAGDALLAIVGDADAAQRRERGYRDELGAWTTADPTRRDGVPAAAFGSWPGPGQVPQRDFTVGGVVVARQAEAFEAAPTLAVLSTRADTVVDWLRAGTALQRLLLVATTHRLRAGFLTQPLELPAFRDEVRALIGPPHISVSGFVSRVWSVPRPSSVPA
jgi:hypothetical protein